MLGRRSVFPPLAYNSPFIDEVLLTWPVDGIKKLSGEVGQTLYETKKDILKLQVDKVNAAGGLIKPKH